MEITISSSIHTTLRSFKMRSGNLHHAFLIVAALFLFKATLVCCNQNATFHCVETERQALLKFKACFDNSSVLSSWKGDDCCNWSGVRCDKSSKHVVALNLRDEDEWNERRSLMLNSGDDVGLVLLKLRFLEHLDLSGNNFKGSNIPPSFGLMKQLRYLNLSESEFSGRIPHQLGNLTNLRVLDLSSYSLEAHDIRWVSQLVSLQHLDMEYVNISSATSPNVFQVLNNLPSLSWLSLSRCSLNSSHLSLGNHPFNSTFLRNFQSLDLSSNSIQGPIPDFISNMTSLKFLDLSDNSFVGPIPNSVESMTTLIELDLSYNDLNGTAPTWMEGKSFALRKLDLSSNQLSGGIPDSIGQLSKLEYFDYGYNELTGVIPESIGKLSNLKIFSVFSNVLEGVVSEAHFASLSNLTELYISYNRLNCEFKPDWRPPFRLVFVSMESCKFVTGFQVWQLLNERTTHFFLSNSSISGSLPENIGHMMPNLVMLYLANNNLTGSVPKSLSIPRDLQVIDISNNQLSGDLPDSWRNDGFIHAIDLSSNNLSGLLPNSIGQLDLLRILRLNNNSLRGELPLALANCTLLRHLDLGENDFSGNITWIGERLTDLGVLRLRRNKFTGYFTSQFCQLTELRILDLADNRLSGQLPHCLHNLSCMVSRRHCPVRYMGFQQERVEAVMKGGVLQYQIGGVRLLWTLDLSGNNFVGSIPKELTSLVSLIGLNMSRNHFSGAIPENIGQLNQLESLDLSRNVLSGTIPSSLSDIYALSRLNLSYNNLSGPIPTGNQLQTLGDPATIYGGNPLLCGPPLLTKCRRDVQPPSSFEDNNEDGREKMWLYLIVMSGFVTGFSGVVGVLIFVKSWRYALFRMVDNVYDKIYVVVALKVKRIKKMLNRNPEDQ